ncbi:hypothetical protein GGI20_006210, partial [Coemansia sp. BCRC 34301]
MTNVVRGIESTMKSMNLEQMSMVMDKFEGQFEDLDVQTGYMEGAIGGVTTLTTPQDEIDLLMRQVADVSGLELKSGMQELPAVPQQEAGEEAVLNERLHRHRNAPILISRMDPIKAMSLLNRACPYLARTGMTALQGLADAGLSGGMRPLSTSAVEQARCGVCPGHTGQSALLAKASECPVVGPSIRANDAAAAAKAAKAAQQAPAAGCPYAKCAESASAANANPPGKTGATAVTPVSHDSQEGVFDYESLYQAKLAKKHGDKSYRYFNNINRLAGRYPQAHTANAANIVT